MGDTPRYATIAYKAVQSLQWPILLLVPTLRHQGYLSGRREVAPSPSLDTDTIQRPRMHADNIIFLPAGPGQYIIWSIRGGVKTGVALLWITVHAQQLHGCNILFAVDPHLDISNHITCSVGASPYD